MRSLLINEDIKRGNSSQNERGLQESRVQIMHKLLVFMLTRIIK